MVDVSSGRKIKRQFLPALNTPFSLVPPAKKQAEMRSYTPTYRENVSNLIGEGLKAIGQDNYNAQNLAKRVTGLAEWSPFGALTAADDASRAYNAGNYGRAGLAALGAIPMVGKGERVAVKAAEDVLLPEARGLLAAAVKPKGKAAIQGEELDRLTGEARGLFDTTKTPTDVPQVQIKRYEPARGVPQRVLDLTSNPEVRKQMIAMIERGKGMGAEKWYNMEPLRQAFIGEFGNDVGTQRFNKYLDYFAGSSPRSTVPENMRNASYYYGLDVKGEPLPAPYTTPEGKVIKNPEPYGHLAQDLHRMNFEKIQSGQGLDFKANPKPLGFVEDLKGNLTPVAVDAHAFKLPAMLSQDPRFLETSLKTSKEAVPRNIMKEFQEGKFTMDEALQQPTFWQGQPKENEYAAMEQYYQGLAKDVGLLPGETQAAGWVGGGKLTGLKSDELKSAMDIFIDRVAYTAQKRGLDPKTVLKQMMHGDKPLLSIAAALGLGLISQQDAKALAAQGVGGTEPASQPRSPNILGLK